MRLCLFLVLVVTGCSLLPADKTKSEAVKSSENTSANHDLTIRRALEVGPERGLRVAREGEVASHQLPAETPMRETLEIHSVASQSASANDAAAGNSSVTIPLFVKVIGLGVGIAVLTGAILFALKSAKGTAFGQGLQLADEALARAIQRKRQVAATTTDSSKQAEIHAELAQLEADRGKLKA